MDMRERMRRSSAYAEPISIPRPVTGSSSDTTTSKPHQVGLFGDKIVLQLTYQEPWATVLRPDDGLLRSDSQVDSADLARGPPAAPARSLHHTGRRLRRLPGVHR